MHKILRTLPILVLAAVLFGACTRGEITPAETAQATPVPASQPTIMPTVAPTEAVLISPGAYPTPGDQITPWSQLIDRKLIKDFIWETYQGTFQGSDKRIYWLYSFRYPTDWYASQQMSLIQGYVQNIPPTQGQEVQGAFIKFEVVTLEDPRVINDGEVIDPQQYSTVLIAGQPCVMRVNTQAPDQVRVVSVIFAYAGGWVAATGYISLSSVDPASLESWTTVMFEILSTFEIQDQGG